MHRPRRRRLYPLLLAIAACGGDETTTFDYPMDDVLRMNHVQAVGTHNSYHVDPANGE